MDLFPVWAGASLLPLMFQGIPWYLYIIPLFMIRDQLELADYPKFLLICGLLTGFVFPGITYMRIITFILLAYYFLILLMVMIMFSSWNSFQSKN